MIHDSSRFPFYSGAEYLYCRHDLVFFYYNMHNVKEKIVVKFVYIFILKVNNRL